MKSGFHWRDGWYFSRMEDGSVLIEKVHSGDEGTNYYDATARIDPASWASIVASVSAKQDTAETFHAAERLHAGEIT